jgi:hypothetical protein
MIKFHFQTDLYQTVKIQQLIDAVNDAISGNIMEWEISASVNSYATK